MGIKGKLGLFHNKAYAKLFIANLASQLGNVIGLTAIAFYMLDRFSSQPFYTTITELMYSLPTFAVFVFAGVFADRLDRKWICLICDWSNAALSLVLVAAVWLDWFPVVFALLFIRSALSKVFQPSGTALYRGVLSREEFPVAIGINQMMGSMFIIFGTGLGALAYWNVGVRGAILIDAISFLVSGLVIKTCYIPLQVRLPNGKNRLRDLTFTSIFLDFKAGLRYIRHHSSLFYLFLGIFIMGVANGGLPLMQLFIMKYKLAPQSYESMQVWLSTSMGVGMFLGSFVASRLAKKIKLHTLITWSFLIMGIVHFLQAFSTNQWEYTGLHFIYAFSVPLCNVAFFGWLGQITEQQMMGRVQALIQPCMMVMFIAMQGWIGVGFPKFLTIESLFLIIGFSELLLFVFYFLVLPRSVEVMKKEEVSQ